MAFLAIFAEATSSLKWIERPILALTLLSSVTAFLLLQVIYLVLFHPLNKVPGPFLAKFSQRWQDYYATRLQKAGAIQTAHLKYGPVVRVGPNEVSFANPALLQSVYGHNIPVVKTEFYDGGRFSSEQNIFTMRIREQHAGRRKLMSRNFAQAPLLDFAPQIISKSKAMLEKLSTMADGPVDVYRWLHRFGLEVVLMQTLGTNPRMIETGKDHPVLKDLEAFQVTFAWMSLFPLLRKYGAKVPIKSIREPFLAQDSWVKYTLKVVEEERAKEMKQRTPFINRMMESEDEYVNRKLTDLEIAEEILGILFAGSGTTANTLAFLFYAVAKDRAIYDKLKKELQENLADWPTDATATLTISQLQNLSYTNAIIFEALRRYPTIPGTMPRRTTSSGITLDGYHIPRNTIVGAQNFTIHANEDYFNNPAKFEPERFLGDDQKRAREAMNPFSIGPRGCLGRNLAMLEMQIVVSMFFRYFDVWIHESMTAKDMRMKDGFSGCPEGQKVVLKLRKSVS